MRITRANLSVAGAASFDKKEPALNRVHLAADGSTVASNGSMLLAVGPPDPVRVAAFPSVDHDEPAIPKDGIGVSLGTVADVRRNLPTDRRIALQQAAVTRCDHARVEILTTDGIKSRTVSSAPMRGTFPKWRRLLAEERRKATTARVCVNRRELISLLKAIDEACPDRGHFSPVFLEIGGRNDGLVLRAQNYETKQRAIGMIMPTTVRGDGWLDESAWERGVFEITSPKARRKGPVARRKESVE